MSARQRIAAVALVLLSCVTVHADYRSDFSEGIKQFRKRQWASAIRYLVLAVNQRPDTGDQILIGGGGADREPYLPNFFLAVAYANDGKCPLAQDAFSKAQSFGVSQKFPRLLADYKSAFARCPALLATNAPPAPVPPPVKPAAPPVASAVVDPAVLRDAVDRALQAIQKAATSLGSLSEFSKNGPLASGWSTDATLGRKEESALSELSTARRKLNEAQTQSDPKRANEAAADASQVYEVSEDIRRTATSRVALLAPPPAPPPAAVASNTTSTTPPTKNPVVPPVVPGPATPSPAPVVNTVPPTLLNAARLFFNADYSNAIKTLSSQTFNESPKAALQADLFRAASNYALYRRGGERPVDLPKLQEARRLVRGCKRRDRRFVPDREAFSPAFLRFYQSTD